MKEKNLVYIYTVYCIPFQKNSCWTPTSSLMPALKGQAGDTCAGQCIGHRLWDSPGGYIFHIWDQECQVLEAQVPIADPEYELQVPDCRCRSESQVEEGHIDPALSQAELTEVATAKDGSNRGWRIGARKELGEMGFVSLVCTPILTIKGCCKEMM